MAGWYKQKKSNNSCCSCLQNLNSVFSRSVRT
uniref:Uncharacterized protein n=1 Tax=Arundo donax TaxID=35708 RepID=A0A0A9CNW2_ARUDO